MSFMKRKNGVFLRAICVILIHTFFLSSVTFAAPSDKPIAKANHDELISNPEKVVIPREYGIVKSKYAGKGGKLIVHIQDAHCNFEAQSNIAGIL